MLLCCLSDGYGEPDSLLEEAAQGCRNLSAGPPYRPIYPRIDLPPDAKSAPPKVTRGQRWFLRPLWSRRNTAQTGVSPDN